MKKVRMFLSMLLVGVSLLGLVGCGSGGGEGNDGGKSAGDSPSEEGLAFSFTGTETYDDGTEYTVDIKAKEGEDAFTLSIEELPMFELGGTYKFVEGKGYKLYFDDVDSQFVYTSYDPETADFSFKYKLDLGEALGTRRITFTGHDEAFAKQYDGEGLGLTPPTFEGSGWGGYIGQFEIAPAKLTCYEDGTATFTAVAVTAVDPKTGTWDYDEETNVYHFNFPPQTFANSAQVEEQPDGTIGYKTVYGESDYRFDVFSETTETDFYTTFDEETQTYSFDLQIVWYVYSMIHMSYTL